MMLRSLYNDLRRYRIGPIKTESTQLFILLLHNPSPYFKSFSKNPHPKISETQNYARVLPLFKVYGFTETEFFNLVEKKPELLLCNPDKTLKPKLEFFSSIGISVADLVKILTLDAPILKRSLKNQIIPSYQFLKSVLHSDENVVAAFKRSTWVFKMNLQNYMAPNIAVLQSHGVPDSTISFSLRTQPRTYIQPPGHFREIVEKTKGMGFDPLRSNFLSAINVFTGFSSSTWERKLEIYRKWGWSDNEILSAFRKKPSCMAVSVKKIDRVMDFVVNKMGWGVSDVVGCPAVILHSLENWTTPRCLVIKALLLKGMIKKDFSLSSIITSKEMHFLNKYVTKYCTEFPELLNLYNRKLDCQEFVP